jgi:hypothetical protein
MNGKVSDSIIKEKLSTAIHLLFKNDAFLLENYVHERTIGHKLAEYLQLQFSEWHVDCEYNKHNLDEKILIRECPNKSKRRVYPDIIIHHRGTDEYNLVVIEIKPYKRKKVNCWDNVKLVEFTKQSSDYKYQLGVFIGFDGISKPQIVYYKNDMQ